MSLESSDGDPELSKLLAVAGEDRLIAYRTEVCAPRQPVP